MISTEQCRTLTAAQLSALSDEAGRYGIAQAEYGQLYPDPELLHRVCAGGYDETDADREKLHSKQAGYRVAYCQASEDIIAVLVALRDQQAARIAELEESAADCTCHLRPMTRPPYAR